jgi:hypothetical protein
MRHQIIGVWQGDWSVGGLTESLQLQQRGLWQLSRGCCGTFLGHRQHRCPGAYTADPTSDGTVIGKIILAGDPARHLQIIATALDAFRVRLKALKQDRVFHVDSLSVA